MGKTKKAHRRPPPTLDYKYVKITNDYKLSSDMEDQIDDMSLDSGITRKCQWRTDREIRCPSTCCNEDCDNKPEEPLPEEYFSIVKVAGKGRGVVTREKIPPMTFLFVYAGEFLTIDEGEKREEKLEKTGKTNYIIGLHKHGRPTGSKLPFDFYLDAGQFGNIGRYCNHSSENPNVEFLSVLIDGVPHQYMMSRRTIDVGEEILYDYGDKYKIKKVVEGNSQITELGELECKYCDTECGDKESLQKHMLLHEPPKHKCTRNNKTYSELKCDKVFAFKGGLKRHIRTYHK